MTPDAYKWLFEEFGAGVLPIINYSGGTEVSGGILSNRVTEVIVPCGFFGPIPGMGAQVLDDSGAQIISGIGELALTLPSPGMPVTFWNEPERYFETYWSRWKGIWWHGDFAEINQDGTWFIRGRSDDTLKIAGKRIGPAEVESIVNSHAMVMESAAIGVPDQIKGEALVIIVSCPGVILESAKSSISQELTDLIVEKLGKPFKPKDVRVIEVLPKNRSGKILRRVIRATYLGLDPGDLSSLDDVGVLDSLREIL
jgi:acetyl-CoA synthetase